MASMIIVSGPNEGDYYPLGKRTMVVGRDEGCPIQILDDLVSRKHLQVRHDAATGSYYALDMKSANGVYINSRKVAAETVLRDGDIIEVGSSKMMFAEKTFDDRESALNHYKKRGERQRSTLMQE